ncbi:MAG: hypothetical protein AABX37_03220 [Nanoarchaeota archaeon]
MSLDKLVNGATEQVGTNTVEYGLDDALSRAASFVGSMPTRAVLASAKVAGYPREETQQDIAAAIPQLGLENTTVRLGYSRVLHDTYRLFTDEKLKDISLVGRVLLGVPTTMITGLLGKLTRLDYYNPFTKTVTVYSDVPAIARHELGHAKDFQSGKYPSLYALARGILPITWYQELKASWIAHRSLGAEQKGQTGRYLMPAFATYLFPAAQYVAGIAFLPFMLGAHVMGNVYRGIRAVPGYVKKLFTKPQSKEKNKKPAPRSQQQPQRIPQSQGIPTLRPAGAPA